MSTTNETRANAPLAIPRKLLEKYLEEAAERLAQRQGIVGTRIREAREAKRWFQKDLAARVHVEPQTISNWERGFTTPDFDKLELLARELEHPIAYFVSETPVVESDASQAAAGAADIREMRVLVDALLRDRGLDPAQILRDARVQPREPEPADEDLERPGEAAEAG